MFNRVWRSRVALILASAFCWAFWGCSAATASEPVEVDGSIATRVSFAKDVGEKLASAGLELLASCTVGRAATEAEWTEARRRCHLRFAFVTPRTVRLVSPSSRTVGREEFEVVEMIITLPLGTGRVWIRSADEYTWFAKWPGSEYVRLCNPIQLLLQEAVPAEN